MFNSLIDNITALIKMLQMKVRQLTIFKMLMFLNIYISQDQLTPFRVQYVLKVLISFDVSFSNDSPFASELVPSISVESAIQSVP